MIPADLGVADAGGDAEASATFFVGRADGGQVFEFTSASLTTAMALDALVRHRLAHCSAVGSHGCR